MVGFLLTAFIITIIAIFTIKIIKAFQRNSPWSVLIRTFTIGIVILILGIFTINVVNDCFVIVPTGYKGVVLRFGAITPRVMEEGLNIKAPMIDKVVPMSIQIRAFTTSASAASKDLQDVSTKITLNYTLEETRVQDIYRILRNDYEKKIIAPAIQEAIKATTAQFNVEELIKKRSEVRDKMEEILNQRLMKHNIIIDAVSITDFQFGTEFAKAIEAKQVSVEQAKKAQNDLEKVKFEMQQKVEQAKAEAEALRLQNQQVTPMVLKLREIEVQKLLAERWDGKMPSTMLSSGSNGFMPLLNVGK